MRTDPGLGQVREFLPSCQALVQLLKLSFLKLGKDWPEGVEMGNSLLDKLKLVPEILTCGHRLPCRVRELLFEVGSEPVRESGALVGV